MDSKCPKCQKMISHEDYLFEVQCSCGARFNPFIGMGDESNGVDAGVSEAADAVGDSFQESKNAFQDIQTFGETMQESIPEPKAEEGFSDLSAPASTPSDSGMGLPEMGSAPVMAHDGNFVFSSAPHLEGYRTEAYLMPVSVQANIDSKAQDPLKEAFLLLKKRAEAQGANAIVGFQWKVASDGTRVFVSGLPLKVKRTS